MKRSFEFGELLFSLREGATLALLSIFIVGVLVVGLISNLLYEVLVQPVSLGAGAMVRVAAVSSLLLALAYWLYRRERCGPRQVSVQVDESRLVPPHRGLIWMLGPGPVDHALCAIRHHAEGQNGRRLEQCWLVMQRGSEVVQAAYNTLATRVVAANLNVRLEPVLVDRLDVEATYSAVRHIFERQAPAEGLTEQDVIADITGGTKPMTAGMVLAALDGARDLEYVESRRDETGAPVAGTLRVVWLGKTFQLERKKIEGAEDGQPTGSRLIES